MKNRVFTTIRAPALGYVLLSLSLFGCAVQQNKKMEGSSVSKDTSLIEEAIFKGDISTLKELLNKGYDINYAPKVKHGRHYHEGATPLSLSIRWRRRDITDYLLKRHADVNVRNADGSTALFFALQQGDFGLEMVKLLLDNNADPNIKDDEGMTPLIYARNGQLTEVTKLLLARGAKDPFEEAVIWVPQVRVEADGTKKLVYGITHGNRATNVLVIAAGNGDLAAAGKLLQTGADINRGDRIDVWGSTPLSIAVLRNHAHMVAYLLDHGADINSRNYNGTTALMQAVANREGNIEMVRLLTARGADVTAKDSQGNSALDYASLSHNTNAVELLEKAVNRSQVVSVRSVKSGNQ